MFEDLIEASSFLLHNYPGAKQCREYLNSRLSGESQNIYKFGYFPDNDNMAALTSIIGNEMLSSLNLEYSRSIEDSMSFREIRISYFNDYPIIMPFKDTYGSIVAIVGRTLLSEEDRKMKKIPKYKNTKFTKGNYLFGLYENKKEIINKDSVYIVEGQFDVIKANEKGLKNIVALGNNNITPYQFSVITRYTNNIFLLLDNDEAGMKGRKSIVDKYSGFANIRNFYLSDQYKDIDEFFSSNELSDLTLKIKI
jgi:DNA primase catalytic core